MERLFLKNWVMYMSEWRFKMENFNKKSASIAFALGLLIAVALLEFGII